MLLLAISDLVEEKLVVASKFVEKFLLAPLLLAGRVHLSNEVLLEVVSERTQ